MFTVSERDKMIFKKLGEALNPPWPKVTRQERMKQVDFLEYLQFIDDARDLMRELKQGAVERRSNFKQGGP